VYFCPYLFVVWWYIQRKEKRLNSKQGVQPKFLL
jgi:hypothetical protein